MRNRLSYSFITLVLMLSVLKYKIHTQLSCIPVPVEDGNGNFKWGYSYLSYILPPNVISG